MSDRTTRSMRRRCPRRNAAPAYTPLRLVTPDVTAEVTDAVTRNAHGRPARPARCRGRASQNRRRPSPGNGLAAALEQWGPSDAELARWAAREPALAGLGSFEALRNDQLDPDVAPQSKDARLAALLRLVAHHGASPAETVLTLLLPGMGHRVTRWAGSMDLDEAWAEMAAGVWARIARYAAAGPPAQRIASKLLGAGTKAMVAHRDRYRAWTERAELCPSDPRPATDPNIDDQIGLRAVLDQAVTARVILERDAELIAVTRIDGATLVAAAQNAGLDYDTTRKRRKNAENELIAHQHRGPGWR
jgi:hypothetical protein